MIKKSLLVGATVLCSASLVNAAESRGGGSQFLDKAAAITDSMCAAMRSTPTNGDADHDFAQMMIPHHKGAVEMAKALLQSGNDPEMRKMAHKAIADQEKDIQMLKDWLKRYEGGH